MLHAKPTLRSKVKILQTISLIIAFRSTVWYITIWCDDSFAGGWWPCYKTNCIIVDRSSWYVLLIWSSQWWYIMKQRIIGIVMTASVTSWRHCASFQNLIFRRQANCRLRIKPYGTCTAHLHVRDTKYRGKCLVLNFWERVWNHKMMFAGKLGWSCAKKWQNGNLPHDRNVKFQ